MMKSKKRGLTLLELLLVMVIIAILVAGLTLTFGCGIRAKAYRTNAMQALGVLTVADHAYYQEYDAWATSSAVLYTEKLIGNDPSVTDKLFTYAPSTTGNGGWTATKIGTPFTGGTVTKEGDGTVTWSGFDCA